MKLIKRLGLVVVTVGLMTLVLIQGIGAMGSAAVEEYACHCSQPVLRLTQENVYWGSYADYANRALSIDYDVSNDTVGYANAHNLQILGTSNTGGVTSIDHGRDINMVSAGECELVTVKYSVPTGVGAFNTRVYATTKDQCGTSYDYPGPMPTP
ncbi:MAG: hypothetical protein HZB44_02150 [Actinobacteria bacterium]|nr:hypothetical protein [Actinomycetota bacterium]